MSINLSALMKQRYDTAANWTAQNPTLLAGEFGIESDTKRWKVGTGATAWTSLLYSNGGTYPYVNADIAAGAEIAVSKLADGSARQLLQTDAAGTGVEWTSDVSIPGVLSVTAGTAALPGIAVSGDPNTGIYSPGADQLAIATGGTGRVFVNAAGLVDISNTTADKLTLSYPGFGIGTFGVDSTGSLLFKADEANTQASSIIQFKIDGGEKLRIDSSGNAGLGGAPANYTGYPNLRINGTSGGILDLSNNGTSVFRLTGDTTGAFYYTQNASYPHVWGAGASERARIDSSGRLLVGTSSDSGGALLQVNGDRIRVGTAKTPASASATGTAGEICWDASYIYVCTATNTWKRTAIATW